MFDKEIVKRELEECIGNDIIVDLDEVIENYTVLDGFYLFRINNDGHLFNENTYIDSFPGFFAKEGSVSDGR